MKMSMLVAPGMAHPFKFCITASRGWLGKVSNLPCSDDAGVQQIRSRPRAVAYKACVCYRDMYRGGHLVFHEASYRPKQGSATYRIRSQGYWQVRVHSESNVVSLWHILKLQGFLY